ncbi:MAG: ABC transporter substrate-binding protein [Planctomycetota bacterium]|nr:ABC transporter substrate-binding protein [Planctomycetota bacterium]
MKNKGSLIGVIVIVLVAIGAGAIWKLRPAPEQARNSLTIGIATWVGFGSGIVGMEKGFFPEMDVQTKTLDDARARQAAFVSGDLDIMISSVDLFAQEAGKGIQGKVFLITDESHGGDGIVAKAEIKTIADLRGKKVAYTHGGPSDYLLFKALERAGVKRNEVKLVAVDDPSRAGETFLSGDVDAAVTWEPFLTNTAESGKGHILATTKDYPEIIVDILVASDKLAADEKLLRQFMEGWLKSVDYIKKHPDEAAAIMAKGLNLPVDDVKGMMAGLRFADHERNRYFFDKAGPAGSRVARLFDEAGKYWKSIDVVEQPVKGPSRVSETACSYFNPG